MLYSRKIDDSLYYLGGNDRRLELFENLFPLPEGVSYNSYLIVDEKTCLLDAVDASKADGFLVGIREVLGERPLDYFVVNHVEPDHSASVNAVLSAYPDCTLVITALGLKFMKQFHPDFAYENWKTELSKDGMELSLGKHQLTLVTAPNVHWPEVTVAYESTTGTLFSADAFGSFKAIEGHLFADEVDYERDWMDEARRYYVNIVGRQGKSVVKLLEKASGLSIRRICPLHGLIFRTEETISLMLEKYKAWATYTPEEQGLVICYGSLYGHSAEMADALAARVAARTKAPVRVYDVSKTDYSYIIADCFRFSTAVFICNNYNAVLYPKMEAFLRELMLLKWDSHRAGILGNMTWGGQAVKMAKEILSEAKALEMLENTFDVKSSMGAEEEEKLDALAAEIADAF